MLIPSPTRNVKHSGTKQSNLSIHPATTQILVAVDAVVEVVVEDAEKAVVVEEE